MNRLALIAVATVVPTLSAMATDPYPLDPLSEMTSRWADAARRVDSLHADIRRFRYDTVCGTVSESEGTLDYARPNLCRLELRPVAAHRRRSLRRGDVEYQPREESASTWIWAETEIILLDPQTRRYDSVLLDVSRSSRSWFFLSPDQVLLLLTSDPKSAADMGYELVPFAGRQQGITAKPVSREAKREFGQIDLLFDSVTGLPRAARAVNPQDTVETVLVLSNVQLNPTNANSNVFHPDADWKRFTEPVAVVPMERPTERPIEVVAGDRPIYEETPFWELLVAFLGTTPD